MGGTERGLFLHRVSADIWTNWRSEEGGASNWINEILLTDDGRVWIGTNDGLELRDPAGLVTSIRGIGGARLGHVTGLAQDPDGNVWISSDASFAGAYRWDGTEWRHFGAEDGLVAARVHRIRPDRRGRLWFLGMSALAPGSNGPETEEPGAFVTEGGRFTRWLPPSDPSWTSEQQRHHGRTYAFAEGGTGLCGSPPGGGLSRWADTVWTHWTVEDGLRRGRIVTLGTGPDDRVWFADARSGLGYIDAEGRPRYLTVADGLPSDVVNELRVGPDGKLWISTFGGLATYEDGRFASFGPESGLSNLHLWPALPTRDRVYVGTLGAGVDVLDLNTARAPAPRPHSIVSLLEGGHVRAAIEASSFWSNPPSHVVETRYRLDGGARTAWRAGHYTVDLGPPGFGRHTLEVQSKGFLGEAGPTAIEHFSLRPPVLLQPVFALPFLAGLLMSAVAIARVIARRRTAEAALTLRQFAVDGTSDGVFIWDENGRCLLLNDAACDCSGYAREELLAQSVWQVWIRPDHVFRNGATAPDVGGSGVIESILRRKDGELVPVEVSVDRVNVDRAVRFVGFVRDLTKRKRAEDRLHVAYNTLFALIRASPLAIMAIDLCGNVTLWNAAAEVLFGRAPTVGATSRPLPEGAAKVREVLERTIGERSSNAGVPVRLECGSRPHTVSLSCWTAPLEGSNGCVSGAVAVLADLTDRERLEREVIRISAREQAQVAADLHDGVGQTLTAAAFLGQVLARRLATTDSSRAAEAEEIVRLVSLAMRQSRTLATELMVAGVERMGSPGPWPNSPTRGSSSSAFPAASRARPT